jgi:hypothetical protein
VNRLFSMLDLLGAIDTWLIISQVARGFDAPREDDVEPWPLDGLAR